jgi:hypothetical protein
MTNLIIAAAGLLVLAGTCYGLVALVQAGLDRRADRLGRPIPDPDRELHWAGAVTGGDTLSRRSLREIGRRLHLDSHRAATTAVIKSMRRHQRRHGGAR